MPVSNRTGCRVLAPKGTALKINGPVGFDNMVEQTVKKHTAEGFDLNVVVLGETALGKSTLMDSLFKTRFDETEHNHSRSKVEITTHQYELQEGSARLRLNISECVGYGDQIDRSAALQPVKEYITAQFQGFLSEEMKKTRDLMHYVDTRCHVCIYLIAPTGHGLKSLDVVALKELSALVNVLPVIAKADTLSKQDLDSFKAQIRKDLADSNIKVYELPSENVKISESDDINTLTANLKEKMPFSVVASRDVVGDKRVRTYPWGKVEVENPAHSDFVCLRDVLLRLNTMDLIHKTHQMHYAKYRSERLLAMGYLETADGDKEASLQDTYERKHAEFMELRNRREMEMRTAFSRKVKDKEAELKAANNALKAKYDLLRKALEEDKAKLQQQINELEFVKGWGQVDQKIDDLKSSPGVKTKPKRSFLG